MVAFQTPVTEWERLEEHISCRYINQRLQVPPCFLFSLGIILISYGTWASQISVSQRTMTGGEMIQSQEIKAPDLALTLVKAQAA